MKWLTTLNQHKIESTTKKTRKRRKIKVETSIGCYRSKLKWHKQRWGQAAKHTILKAVKLWEEHAKIGSAAAKVVNCERM